jgi:hypothetical protein
MEGKTLHTEMAHCNVGENSYSIPIDNAFENGFYFLKISNEGISITKKFVVVK